MRPWLKLDASAPQHPKVAPLSDPEFRAWILLLCSAKARSDPTWCGQKHMEACIGKYARHRDALVDAGLLDRDGELYMIHDFDTYQVDPTNAERQRRYRQRNAAVTADVTDPVTSPNDQRQRQRQRQRDNGYTEASGRSARLPVAVHPEVVS